MPQKSAAKISAKPSEKASGEARKVVVFGICAQRLRHRALWAWPLVWLAIEFVRSEWSPLRFDLFSDTLDPMNFTWFGLGHPRLAYPAAAQSRIEAAMGTGDFLEQDRIRFWRCRVAAFTDEPHFHSPPLDCQGTIAG